MLYLTTSAGNRLWSVSIRSARSQARTLSQRAHEARIHSVRAVEIAKMLTGGRILPKIHDGDLVEVWAEGACVERHERMKAPLPERDTRTLPLPLDGSAS